MSDAEIIPGADPEMALPELETPLEERLPLDRDGRAPRGTYDADGRPRDRLGRRQIARLNWMTLLRTDYGPGIAAAFATKVPGAYYSLEDDETVVVACPCGLEPRVGLTHSTECECERVYLWLGNELRVGNSPTPAAA